MSNTDRNDGLGARSEVSRTSHLPTKGKKGMRCRKDLRSQPSASAAAAPASGGSGKVVGRSVDSSASGVEAAPRLAPLKRSGQVITDEFIPVTEEEMSGENVWGHDEATQRNLFSYWLPIGALMLVGLVGWGLYAAMNKDSGGEIGADQTVVSSTVRAGELGELTDDEIARGIEMDRNIDEALEGIYGSSSVSELMQWVRLPMKVEPFVQKFYETNPLPSRKVIGKTGIEAVGRKQGSFWGVSVLFEGDRSQFLVLEEGEGGKMRMDWEFFAEVDRFNLERLLETRPTGLYRMRLTLEQADMNVYGYSDVDQWASFVAWGVNSPEDEYGFAFLERDTMSMKHLETQFRLSGTPQLKVIALVRFPQADKAKRSLVIENIVQTGWVEHNISGEFAGEVTPSPATASFVNE